MLPFDSSDSYGNCQILNVKNKPFYHLSSVLHSELLKMWTTKMESNTPSHNEIWTDS